MPRKRNGKWVTVGKLWKKKRSPDKLTGVIDIEHLGIRMNVYAFIKSGCQKRDPSEEDIRISMVIDEPEEEEDNPF